MTYFCIVFYILAALGGLCRLQALSFPRLLVLMLAWSAVLIHAGLLYQEIETGAGQNLTPYNVLSLMGWLVSLIVVSIASKRPVESAGVFIFPLSAFFVFLAWYFPGEVVLHTGENLLQLIHILSSVFAVGIIGLSGVQAAVMAVQAKRLRQHASNRLLSLLPPLETAETVLFSALWIGFVLLTISVLTGVIYWNTEHNIEILGKVFFVMVAWCIFAVLLVGRHLLGWRGMHAVQWTLGGLILLLLAYTLRI